MKKNLYLYKKLLEKWHHYLPKDLDLLTEEDSHQTARVLLEKALSTKDPTYSLLGRLDRKQAGKILKKMSHFFEFI